MKQFLLIPFLLIIAGAMPKTSFAQFHLKISIDKNDKVSFTLNETAVADSARAALQDEGNTIQIVAENKAGAYVISFLNLKEPGASQFSYAFGAGQEIPLQNGTVTKTFKKGEELLQEHSALALPMSVVVVKSSQKLGAIIIRNTAGQEKPSPDDDKPAIPELTKIAYWDAFNLKDEGITELNYRIILSYYAGSRGAILTMGQLVEKYKGNPFSKDLFSDTTFKEFSNNTEPTSISTATAKASGSLGIANIADGIARFLIKRGKEEINAAFFERLKKFLDQHEEFKTLFPATNEFLDNINSYEYSKFLQSLRDAFRKDLSNIIIHLKLLIELPKYQELLKELPEIRAAIYSASIVSELSQSENGIMPDSVIHELAGIREWQEIHPNLGSSWKLLDLLSQSVRNKEAKKNDKASRWIKISDFNRLLHDVQTRNTRNIYLGLLYQQGDSIQFQVKGSPLTFRGYIEQNKSQILRVAGLIENFVILANDVDKSITDIRTKLQSGKPEPADYYTYIGKSINIIEYGFTIAQIFNENLNADPYITIAKNGNELYRHIYTQDYNSAIMDIYNILHEIFNEREKLKQDYVDRKGAATKGLNDALNAKDSFPDPEVLQSFLRYGNFIASVVKAESADEVENAIEAAALPAGSYSIKQRSSFTFALNGYIGYAWDFNGGLYANGIYAPVGLSISTGLSKGKGGALTLFSSIIDVGSIATYRLKNGNTDELKQEVRLESIFSPSAQLIYSVPKWPLAVCIGYKRTPKLFYSNQTDFTTVLPKDVFNLGILIDIPIFNFISRPYYSK